MKQNVNNGRLLILLLSKQTQASENQRQKVKPSNHKLGL